MTHRASFTHNMEIAHRLYLQPGKCQQIHGHSMKVTLTIEGEVNEGGILGGVDFSEIKETFRSYLDDYYDHHLLLNRDDPWAKPLWFGPMASEPNMLPGIHICEGDPTTENLTTWIFYALNAKLEAGSDFSVVSVHIQETPSNAVEYSGSNK